MGLSAAVWNQINNQWNNPIFIESDEIACHQKLVRMTVNCFHKALVALAAMIAAVVTPILALIDLCRGVKAAALQTKNVSVAKTILDFYQGGRSDRGVTLEEIWKWGEEDSDRLETQHDYIQWLFPLKDKGMNQTAALTDDKTTLAFKNDSQLRNKMLRSLDVMLKFYGFTRTSDNRIEIAPNFKAQSKNWLKRSNHNHLRITRILNSLHLHGLKPHAQSFLVALEKIYRDQPGKIGERALKYWRAALK